MNPISSKFRSPDKGRKEKKLSTELIEIGAVKLDDAYVVQDEFSILIKPVMNDRIEGHITSLTGIVIEDVADAVLFREALTAFSDWVGDAEAARIYSWSRSDLNQLENECSYKEVPFPANLTDWTDFQEMFPRVTEINLQRQLSLEAAAGFAGVPFDERKAHRALYDARVTAELVRLVLTGEYKEQMSNIRNIIKPQVEHSTFSLGDKFGAQLAALFDTGEAGEEEN